MNKIEVREFLNEKEISDCSNCMFSISTYNEDYDFDYELNFRNDGKYTTFYFGCTENKSVILKYFYELQNTINSIIKILNHPSREYNVYFEHHDSVKLEIYSSIETWSQILYVELIDLSKKDSVKFYSYQLPMLQNLSDIIEQIIKQLEEMTND